MVKASAIAVGLIVLVLVVVAFCVFSTKKGDDVALLWRPEGRVVVAFFSQSKVGNTRQVAEWIAEATGAMLWRLNVTSPIRSPMMRR